MGASTLRTIARLLIVSIFLHSGYTMLTGPEPYIRTVNSALSVGAYDLHRYGFDTQGLSPPLILMAGLLEVVGSVLILLGFDKIGAAMLLTFLVPVTLVMHQPLSAPKDATVWPLPYFLERLLMEPEEAVEFASKLKIDKKQLIQMLKNCGLVGAMLLMVAQRWERREERADTVGKPAH